MIQNEFTVDEPQIRDFSSFKISNEDPPFYKRTDPDSNINFNEETKQETLFGHHDPHRKPTTNEMYWQNYNHIEGCKIAIS